VQNLSLTFVLFVCDTHLVIEGHCRLQEEWVKIKKKTLACFCIESLPLANHLRIFAFLNLQLINCHERIKRLRETLFFIKYKMNLLESGDYSLNDCHPKIYRLV